MVLPSTSWTKSWHFHSRIYQVRKVPTRPDQSIMIIIYLTFTTMRIYWSFAGNPEANHHQNLSLSARAFWCTSVGIIWIFEWWSSVLMVGSPRMMLRWECLYHDLIHTFCWAYLIGSCQSLLLFTMSYWQRR